MDDFSKLEKPVRDLVKATIKKFAEHTHAGIHLEKVTRCKDDRIRTVRVDQFWRGVVYAPERGDTYYAPRRKSCPSLFPRSART